MPYFVFHVTGKLQKTGSLSLLGEFGNYREARTLAREKRGELDTADPASVRLVFGETQDLAEALLRTPREAPILQEWEK